MRYRYHATLLGRRCCGNKRAQQEAVAKIPCSKKKRKK
jgi:hypothetical protein